MKEYMLVYFKSFQISFEMIIEEWENEFVFFLVSIKRFVGVIQKVLELIKNFLIMYEEVFEIYGIDILIYWIVIGKSYVLFYWIDYEKKEIFVGCIF